MIFEVVEDRPIWELIRSIEENTCKQKPRVVHLSENAKKRRTRKKNLMRIYKGVQIPMEFR